MKKKPSEDNNCNRIRLKVGKEWELEVSSKSTPAWLVVWLSTLVAGFIVVYLLLNL